MPCRRAWGLGAAEGQQPGQPLLDRVVEDGLAGEGVGVAEEVEQRGDDRLLVADLVGGQLPSQAREPTGAVDQLLTQPCGAGALAGGVEGVADGRRRRGVVDGQMGGAAQVEAALDDAGGALQVLFPAVRPVPVEEEAGQPGHIVQPRFEVPGLRAAARGVGLVEEVAYGEAGPAIQQGAGLLRVCEASDGGGLQQQGHGDPLRAVGPVRPAVGGAGQPGPGVHRDEGMREQTGPLHGPLVAGDEGDAAAHDLPQREMEEHLGTGAVADVQRAGAVCERLDPVLASASRSTFTCGSGLLTDAASTMIGVPVSAAYAEKAAGGRVAAVNAPTDSYQPSSHASETDSPGARRSTGCPPNASGLRTWSVTWRTR